MNFTSLIQIQRLTNIIDSSIKQIIYNDKLNKFIIATNDGCYQLNEQLQEKIPIIEKQQVFKILNTQYGILIALQTNELIFLDYEGSAKQIEFKSEDRISAMCYNENNIYIGDWSGNLYILEENNGKFINQGKILKFSEFKYKDRQVVDGIYCLQCLNQVLLCGLSSGQVAMLKFGDNYAEITQIHKHPIRSMQLTNDFSIITVSNDGNVCITNFEQNKFIQFNTIYDENEYLFSCKYFQFENNNYVAVGGTNRLIEIFNINKPEDPQLAFTAILQSDCWSIEYFNGMLYCGCDNGQVCRIKMIKEQQYQNIQISKQILTHFQEDKFLKDSKNYFDFNYIKQEYNYESVEQLVDNLLKNKISKPLIIASINNIPYLFYYHQDKIHLCQQINQDKKMEKLQFDQLTNKLYNCKFNVQLDQTRTGEDPKIVAQRFLVQYNQLNPQDMQDVVAFLEENVPIIEKPYSYLPTQSEIINQKQQQLVIYQTYAIKWFKKPKTPPKPQYFLEPVKDNVINNCFTKFQHLNKSTNNSIQQVCKQLSGSLDQLEDLCLQQNQFILLAFYALAIQDEYFKVEYIQQDLFQFLIQSVSNSSDKKYQVNAIKVVGLIIQQNKELFYNLIEETEQHEIVKFIQGLVDSKLNDAKYIIQQIKQGPQNNLIAVLVEQLVGENDY